MVKGDSTISIADGVPNSMLKIEFYEDENGDGYHDATSEDMYETGLIPVDWTGWRMISLDMMILKTCQLLHLVKVMV